MSGTVTFSVTVLPQGGAEDTFRNKVQNLRLHDLEDCFLTVFHIGDSYALLSGEAIPAAHTATNSALSAYLARCLGTDEVGLDLQVKIDETTMPPGPRGKEPMIPRIFPLYPFI